MLHRQLAATFRTVVSGSPDGRPAWVQQMEHGSDAGLFGPGSAPWVVHGHVATLVGGIRALLLQTLHPLAMAGVSGHSRYRDDPIGRLTGTARWLSVLTFASTEQIDAETRRVTTMHARVTGTTDTPTGPARYAAADPHLLGWVHAAFTDSFLTAHLTFGPPIPGGPDAYVRDWGRAVQPLGVTTPPASAAELDALLETYRRETAVTAATRDAVAWLARPPLPASTAVGYQVLWNAAVALLDPRDRDLLGVRALPGAIPAARALLTGMRVVLGDTSPSEAAARTRLARLT